MRRLELELATRKEIGAVGNADVRVAHQTQTLEKAHRRILDLEGQLKRMEERYPVLEGNLERARKEEARWK